ncbi:FMN-linked oxidoreductase [Rhizopus microsporus ATCC 52813]|uniref:tRNA-dihydrouridine(47) synthase [NAD(P)(+)] n=2 Tax=Rhizopus TaxID=4842 RepID=A0A2G4ST63_RHIZD|nr:FMN-linked oxidoreductase [Rhizopus microsporus ATCC 52813]PHZ11988.1 FMN-linked oxidoreductase [Rhizopus microsporus ATCC 52813]
MSEPKPGEALIKPEYRKERWFSDAETAVNDDEAEGASTIEPKKQKNARGANKGQRGKKRIEDSVRLCKYVAVDEECKIGEKCRFSHDLEAYLAAKPADIGNRCVNFDLFGKCSYGYKCRFLSAHMDENKKLIVDEKKMAENNVYTINGISHETQVALNRSKYKFPRTEAYMATVKVEIAEEQAMKDANALKRKLQSSSEEQKGIKKQKSDESNDSEDDEFFDASNEFTNVSIEPAAAEAPTNQEDKPIGPIDLKYKKIIDFRNKTYLAPLTTVGNLPFRRVCKEYGVDITCGEMALAFNLLQGQQSEWALTKRHKSEDIFGIQICGSKVEQVTKACEVLNNEVDVDFIDLNMGCPIDLVFKQGAGSALLDARGRMFKILRGMQTVTDIPITAKFRMGIKDNYPIADRVVPKLEELGIALGSLHGRSRAQRYTRKADWEYIGTMKQLTNSMPLYGNGDIMSFEDYNRCKEISGVDGVMIGRGALIKPWIFDEIKNQRHYDISANERFDMLKRFCDYGLEHWGSDSQGVNITRRFFCEWQSFLYRYIPVGILERPPQRMNERPPPFQGRNDLETLMASPLASDWVKLSELFLGPAPEDFKFVPKHKANSFESIQV